VGRQPAEKQRFRLSDGLCMEDESHSIAHFDARVKDGNVQLKA
jgi:nitrite reductase (NADH) small subunit